MSLVFPEDNPESVYHSRDPEQEREEDVDEEPVPKRLVRLEFDLTEKLQCPTTTACSISPAMGT